MSRVGPTSDVVCQYLVYADDVLCAVAHPNKRVLRLAAWENAEDAEGVMHSLGLGMSRREPQWSPCIADVRPRTARACAK